MGVQMSIAQIAFTFSFKDISGFLESLEVTLGHRGSFSVISSH